MLDSWKENRMLKRKKADLEKQKAGLIKDFVPEFEGDNPNSKELSRLSLKLYECNRRINTIETERLLRKATKLGIDFPDKPGWWWNDIDDEGVNYRNYLTDSGEAGVLRLIREERRKSVEWWVKIIGGVITLLTGLAGSIIGIIAILKK